MQQRCKAFELLGRRPLGAFHGFEARLDQSAVLRIVQLVARDADDAAFGWQRAVAERLEQRGHQLAPGEIAGAAEQDEVERHGATIRAGEYRKPQCNLVSGVGPRQAVRAGPCLLRLVVTRLPTLLVFASIDDNKLTKR
jgi:hypothetical protein